MKIKVLILMCLIVFSGYSQNIKKIYKSIKNNELEEAILESSKTDSKAKFDENEFVLFQLSQCLLQSNSNSSVFKPYDAFNQFKSISISKIDETNEYLNKYDLSINKIQDLIYTGVVFEAKKVNTEYSYNKALEICKPCSYEQELIELKTLSAFNEAKNIMSLTSLNKFINRYSTSKFVDLAIDMRDSLVYENTNKDYSSLLRFTKEYPNSKLTPKVILELPDVLYKEAIENNTIESLKRFLTKFPIDDRCKIIEDKLSKIKYTEISINKINKWKVDSLNNQYNENYSCNYTLKLPFLNNKLSKSQRDYDKNNFFNIELIQFSFNGKSGFINKYGKQIIPLNYDNALPFSDGLAAVELNGKWGFIDSFGKEIIPLNYDNVSPFSESLAAVKLNGKWGVIDNNGVVIIPIEFQRIKVLSTNGFTVLEGRGGLFIFDKLGKKISSPLSLVRKPIYDSIIAYGSQDRKIIIYANGKESKVLKDYTDFNIFREGLVSVEFNEKWGFIDKFGKEIISVKYDKVENFSEGLAAVKLNGKWGFIDKTGKEIIPLIYDRVSEFIDGISITELNNKQICINKYGKEITILQKYQFASPFINGFAKVEFQGNYGLINKNGKEIIPIKYDEVNFFHDGFSAVSKNGKWGFVDTNGIEIIPIKYNEVTNFNNGVAFVIENCELKILTLYNHKLFLNEISNNLNKNESNKIVEKVNNNIKTLNQSQTDIIYDIVDESPEFPGGMNAFYNSLNSKLIIPKVAEDNNLSGSCYIKFIVRSDGSLTDVMITRGITNCKECDNAIIKAVKESPKWRAAKIDGKNVSSQMQIKLDFNK